MDDCDTKDWWIPYNLTTQQKQVRIDWSKEMLNQVDDGYIVSTQKLNVRVFKGEEKTMRVKWIRSVAKRIVPTFFCKTGHVATISLENRRMVNTEWYTTIWLPTVLDKVRYGVALSFFTSMQALTTRVHRLTFC